MVINGKWSGFRVHESISTLQPGDHIYHSYEVPTSQLPLLTSFIRAGLKAGQQCVHVADDLYEGIVSDALKDMGVDTRAEKDRGALRFLSKWEWRHQEELEPAVMAHGLATLVAQGQRSGCTGTRIWVDKTWTLNPGVDPLQLEAWETLLHRLIESEPVIVTCAYNSRRLPTSAIKAGENTHPWCMTGNRLLPNDRSRLAALFAKHAPLLRRLDPPSRPPLTNSA